LDFTWFDHLYAFFLLVIVPFMSLQSGNEEGDWEFLPPKKHLFFSNGLMLLIGAMLVATSWNITDRPWHTLGVALPQWNELTIGLTIAISVFYLADQWLSWRKNMQNKEEIKNLSYVVPVTWQEFTPFLFLAFAAGISEEVIFRGFLIPYLTTLLNGVPGNMWLVLAFTSASFSVSHAYQGWKAVLKIALVSFLLGGLFIASQSLLLVILIHICIDIISGVTSVLLFQRIEADESQQNAD